MGEIRQSIILTLLDRLTGPAAKVNQSLGQLNNSVAKLRNVGASLSSVGREAGVLTAKFGVLAGGVGWLLKRQLIDTASEFEQFRMVLETVEGGSAKAQKSLDWLNEFSRKTPYQLGEVTDAFVRLRNYGISATDGSLRAAGDAASALNKPLSSAVEALSDAMTNEYERLKEMGGITAETKGSRVRFNWLDREGKQQFKIVDAHNKKLIQSTIVAIWNDRYYGAMEKQSRGWRGMLSTIADWWTYFKQKVMSQGVFDWMKGKLKTLLELLDKMSKDGSLDRWAKTVGDKLKAALVDAWDFGKGVWEAARVAGKAVSWLAEKLGGFRNLGIALVGLLAGRLIWSIGRLAVSVIALGKALADLLLKYRKFGIGSGGPTPPGTVADPYARQRPNFPPGTFPPAEQYTVGAQSLAKAFLGALTRAAAPAGAALAMGFLAQLYARTMNTITLRAPTKELTDLRKRKLVMGIGGPESVRAIERELDRRGGGQPFRGDVQTAASHNASPYARLDVKVSDDRVRVKLVRSHNLDMDAGPRGTIP